MSQYIDFGEGHTTVVGKTRSGKTYAVEKSLEKVKQGVLFFNTQHIPVSNVFVDADGSDDEKVLIKALRKGEKINFRPSRETRWKQLKALINILFKAGEQAKLNIYIVVDECHLADRKIALPGVIEIATTGLSYGLKGIYISQRPALIDNTLMTQSMQFIFFKTSMEKKYFDSYELPFDDIQAGLTKGGQFSYMTYDFEKLEGAFKV